MQRSSRHWAEQRAVPLRGNSPLKKPQKNRNHFEPLRLRKRFRVSAFSGYAAAFSLLRREDADDAVPCILERGTGADAACQQSGQSAPDGLLDGLEGELLCEMPGRMCRRTGLFCALVRRAKKKFLFIVLRWVGRNFVKYVEYNRKICEKQPTNIP